MLWSGIVVVMSTTYTITQVTLGGLGGETETAYKVSADGKTLRATYATEADAEAAIQQMQTRAATIADLRAGYEANGLRLVRSGHGLPKAARMRGVTRWLVVRGEDEIVAIYDRLEDVPAVETPAERVAIAPPTPAEPVETVTARGTITDTQAATILDLIADGAHEEGGYYAGPTTRAGVLALSREDATHYITSLRGEY